MALLDGWYYTDSIQNSLYQELETMDEYFMFGPNNKTHVKNINIQSVA